MSHEFRRFASLSEEEQTRAIRERPIIHLEPVMVHATNRPPMGVYHFQLGAERTVLTGAQLAVFMLQIERASQQLQQWTRERT